LEQNTYFFKIFFKVKVTRDQKEIIKKLKLKTRDQKELQFVTSPCQQNYRSGRHCGQKRQNIENDVSNEKMRF
jgi:hypothetical protein